jgi:predicted nucleic acid-binding protein
MILLDANVILDVWNLDPAWHQWSSSQLKKQSVLHELAISPVVYAEISTSFGTPAALDEKLDDLEILVIGIPRHAAFLAGKAFAQYRRKGGTKTNVLADFFIGAHAAVLGCSLLTRDTRRFAAYFPTVQLIHP